MFDAEKLLGQLLTQGLKPNKRRRGRSNFAGQLGSQLGGKLGLGAIGLVIAAYEHFTQDNRSAPVATNSSPPPPPPPAAQVAQAIPATDATLLIRAMIAAAHADGHMDANEQGKILDQLIQSGLSSEERGFLLKEMQNPLPLEELIAQVRHPQAAEEVYAVACLCIDIDHPEERAFLQRLGEGLKLDHANTERIESALG